MAAEPFDLVSEFDRAGWREIASDIKALLPDAAFPRDRLVAMALPACRCCLKSCESFLTLLA
jgi:hypothetical protein